MSDTTDQIHPALTVDDILPCPFCGHAPNVRVDDYINGRFIVDPDFYIECENYQCCTTVRIEGKDTDFNSIVAAWNRRAGKPDPQIDAATYVGQSAVEVCFECDIADCHHIRSRRGINSPGYACIVPLELAIFTHTKRTNK